MDGWVSGAGRLGTDAGPEGCARLIAPPGASGTEAGGIGGGRSVNIWADTEAGITAASMATSANAKTGRLLRPDPLPPLPPMVMPHAFHRKRGKFKPGQGDKAHGTGMTPGYCARGRGPVTLPAQADPP